VSTGWRSDKAWSDKFIPEIKRILGEHLIAEASEVEDQLHNTDLVVLKLRDFRIACRVRRWNYNTPEYGGQFTIRSLRHSGRETEMQKLLNGWGDYFFYGFEKESCCRLARWTLGDLSAFRLWHQEQTKLNWGNPPGIEKKNRDGSSDFRAFKIADMPPGFVVASGDECEAVPQLDLML